MTRKRTTILRVASSRAVDDFKIIRGIGPLYEKHLHDAGIRTFGHLAKKTPEDVATHIPNLSASQIRKQGWILQARKLASKKTEAKPRRKISTFPTTSQHYENFTVEFLLNEKNKLRRLRIMHVQSGDVETWANWKQKEVSHFLARHAGVQFLNEEVPAAKSKSAVKKTKQAKSLKSKTQQSRSSKQKPAKVIVAASREDISQKAESPAVSDVKKDGAKVIKPEASQSHSLAQKSVKPDNETPSRKSKTSLVPEVKKGQAKSVKPILETPPKEIFLKPEAQMVPKVEQDQVKSAPVETAQSQQLAPILFGPAAEIIPKRFLKKSQTSPVPDETSHQADSSQPETPQPLIVRESKSQMGAIRLLKWNISKADSDQPVQSLPRDQNFDVKLTLDISSLPLEAKSQLDITGILLAKKLGTHERRVIGETQLVLPYSPIINLRVGKAALEQGLYRLEAEVKLKDSETVSFLNGIDTVFQGGLFQVY